MLAKYNGIPLFNVDEDDFFYVLECLHGGGRLLSKNIKCESLKEYYVKTRKPVFAVFYNDVIVSWGNEV